MVDPKLWPTKTKEDERDWYVEARPGSANYRGDCVRFVRDWYTDRGRQYTNEPAEDVIAQLLEERHAAIWRAEEVLEKAERAMRHSDEVIASCEERVRSHDAMASRYRELLADLLKLNGCPGGPECRCCSAIRQMIFRRAEELLGKAK